MGGKGCVGGEGREGRGRERGNGGGGEREGGRGVGMCVVCGVVVSE